MNIIIILARPLNKLYILVSVLMALTVSQGQSSVRGGGGRGRGGGNNFSVLCLAELTIDMDDIQYVVTTCLLKLVVKLLCTSNIKRRELC